MTQILINNKTLNRIDINTDTKTFSINWCIYVFYPLYLNYLFIFIHTEACHSSASFTKNNRYCTKEKQYLYI